MQAYTNAATKLGLALVYIADTANILEDLGVFEWADELNRTYEPLVNMYHELRKHARQEH